VLAGNAPVTPLRWPSTSTYPLTAMCMEVAGGACVPGTNN
jgi:hypothetical protein